MPSNEAARCSPKLQKLLRYVFDCWVCFQASIRLNLQEAKKVVFPVPDHSAEDDEQKVSSSFPSLFAQCFCDFSQREQLEALAKQERDLLIHTVFRFLAALTDEVCLLALLL